jgi:exodeoxyribonuclease VII large subunit
MNPITISALTTHIVNLFEADETLRDVWVVGEVSNWKRAASGHIYFSLKDGGATLSAVMWRGNALGQNWLPRQGDQILAHGYVGVYPERGVYQLYADQIRPAGRGQLYAQFEALKARLAAEGLFAPERKRPIPALPRRIGVITSAGAAALRDVLRTLAHRWPLVDVILFPTLVQGADAPSQIVAALSAANRYSQAIEPLDVLLLVRGGGSIEDLWSFNDEAVAYAVAASEVPVIVGVGHETDFTIADFVADLRAPTPTAAAAAAVPDRADVIEQFRALQRQLAQRAESRLDDALAQLGQAQDRLRRVHPRRQLDLHRQRLDDRTMRLHRVAARILDQETERLEFLRLRLDGLNPINVLARGYSIVQRKNGQVVTGPDEAVAGETLTVRAAHGEYWVEKK